MCLSLRIFIQLCNHLVVVFHLLSFVLSLLNEMLIDYRDKLVISLIQHLWGHLRHIWLVEQEPISMFTLKNREITIEKGPKCLKFFLACHFLLDVVRCVYQVV